MPLGYFTLFFNLCALPAFVTLALLIVRLPWLVLTEKLRKFLMYLLFVKLHLGPIHITLFTVMIIVSLLTFGDATRTWYRKNAVYDQTRSYHGDGCKVLALKWRAERNWWMSFAAAGAWLAVYRLNSILKSAYENAQAKQKLEKKVADAKKTE